MLQVDIWTQEADLLEHYFTYNFKGNCVTPL